MVKIDKIDKIDWTALIKQVAQTQEDSVLIPFTREQAEDRQDNYTWFHQNDVSPQEHAYDLTVQPKDQEGKPF